MGARSFPLLLSLFLSLGAVALGIALAPDLKMQTLLAARWTARVSFPIFILTYCASSLVRLWPGGWNRAVLRHRRQWGLGFAFAHTVHLLALASHQIVMGTPPMITTLIGGGGAYVFLYAMALTSSDAAMRSMGIWWKRLHMIGMHWLWFVFTSSYLGRIFDPERMMQGIILFPICIGALGLRLLAQFRNRQKPATG